MTTELVLLLGLFAFVLFGVFTKIPRQTFENSGPKLGARIERQISVGQGLTPRGRGPTEWQEPQ